MSGSGRAIENEGERVTYLLVKLDEGGLEELVEVGALVVGVLHVAEALAEVGLFGQEDLLDLARQRVQRHLDILCISDFLELNVGDFLVVHQGRVVSGHEAWQFREIGSHF